MFRNLHLYRWKFEGDATFLGMLLARRPCQQIDLTGAFSAAGFDAPCAHARGVLHNVGGQWLTRHTREQKQLPAAVVKRELDVEIAAFEERTGYKPGRKEVAGLKERVIVALMPRAFTQIRHTNVWIDPKHGWMGIDAASPADADAVLKSMQQAFNGDAPDPVRLKTAISPTAVMAEWLSSLEAPAESAIDADAFEVDDACELIYPCDEKPSVRYSRQPLTNPDIAREISAHLKSGKMPRSLALTWGQSLSFILTDKGELKRLRPLEAWQESLMELEHDTVEDLFDMEFAMMAEAFRHFATDLVTAMGGPA